MLHVEKTNLIAFKTARHIMGVTCKYKYSKLKHVRKTKPHILTNIIILSSLYYKIKKMRSSQFIFFAIETQKG